MSRGSAGIFVLCLLLHLAAIAALLQATPDNTSPVAIPEPPKLLGMLIAPAPKIAPAPALHPVTPPPGKTASTRPTPAPKPAATLAVTKPRPVAPHPVAKAAAALTTMPATATPAPARSAGLAETPTELPSADAAGLNNKAPLYPLLSRKRKEQGTVWLSLLVSKEGRVAALKLKKTSGFARLDQAAMQAVKHWTFQPARKAGQPIDYWYELPLKFSLNQS